MTAINFSDYSDDELLQSLQSIDRDTYPDNFRRLVDELKKRRDNKREAPEEEQAAAMHSGDTYPLIPDKPSGRAGKITLIILVLVIAVGGFLMTRPVMQTISIFVPEALVEKGETLASEVAEVAVPLTRLQIESEHPDNSDALKALLDKTRISWNPAEGDGGEPALMITFEHGPFADTKLAETLVGLLQGQVDKALQQQQPDS